MPPLTQLRKRLSLEEKVQIIADSKKPGFNKANAMKKYGISQAGESVQALSALIQMERDLTKDKIESKGKQSNITQYFHKI